MADLPRRTSFNSNRGAPTGPQYLVLGFDCTSSTSAEHSPADRYRPPYGVASAPEASCTAQASSSSTRRDTPRSLLRVVPLQAEQSHLCSRGLPLTGATCELGTNFSSPALSGVPVVLQEHGSAVPDRVASSSTNCHAAGEEPHKPGVTEGLHPYHTPSHHHHGHSAKFASRTSPPYHPTAAAMASHAADKTATAPNTKPAPKSSIPATTASPAGSMSAADYRASLMAKKPRPSCRRPPPPRRPLPLRIAAQVLNQLAALLLCLVKTLTGAAAEALFMLASQLPGLRCFAVQRGRRPMLQSLVVPKGSPRGRLAGRPPRSPMSRPRRPACSSSSCSPSVDARQACAPPSSPASAPWKHDTPRTASRLCHSSSASTLNPARDSPATAMSCSTQASPAEPDLLPMAAPATLVQSESATPSSSGSSSPQAVLTVGVHCLTRASPLQIAATSMAAATVTPEVHAQALPGQIAAVALASTWTRSLSSHMSDTPPCAGAGSSNTSCSSCLSTKLSKTSQDEATGGSPGAGDDSDCSRSWSDHEGSTPTSTSMSGRPSFTNEFSRASDDLDAESEREPGHNCLFSMDEDEEEAAAAFAAATSGGGGVAAAMVCGLFRGIDDHVVSLSCKVAVVLSSSAPISIPLPVHRMCGSWPAPSSLPSHTPFPELGSSCLSRSYLARLSPAVMHTVDTCLIRAVVQQALFDDDAGDDMESVCCGGFGVLAFA